MGTVIFCKAFRFMSSRANWSACWVETVQVRRRRSAVSLALRRRARELDITYLPSDRIARAGIGLVPQGRRIFPDLTVRENLLLGARKKDHSGWDLAALYQQMPRLRERESHHGDQLSGGEQQMVAIGRALMSNPDLLLMDEPTEGLAPLIVREIARLLVELKAKRQSILLVEQSLPLALELADRVYVMSKGRIVFEGTPDALSGNEEVKRQYLGV
jgi:branched-chain amino acid transport system ATP-binding protein